LDLHGEACLARECRIYIYNLALKLGVRIRGAGLAEGIEIFPKHDELRAGEFGNAIRGPLEFIEAQTGGIGSTVRTTPWRSRSLI